VNKVAPDPLYCFLSWFFDSFKHLFCTLQSIYAAREFFWFFVPSVSIVSLLCESWLRSLQAQHWLCDSDRYKRSIGCVMMDVTMSRVTTNGRFFLWTPRPIVFVVGEMALAMARIDPRLSFPESRDSIGIAFTLHTILLPDIFFDGVLFVGDFGPK
jgi:hypothetical protein